MGSVRATGNQIASGIALQTDCSTIKRQIIRESRLFRKCRGTNLGSLFAKWQDTKLEWRDKLSR